MSAVLRACAVIALTGCSFGMQGVSPTWDGKTEPSCSSTAVMMDRLVGASLLVAASATFAQNSNELGAAVTVPIAGIGVLYEVAASYGARRVAECQRARAQWRNSNVIKPVADDAPAAAHVASSAAPSRSSSSSSSSSSSARPWATGVSEADQARALEIYVAANRAFVERRYADALLQYKGALTHWDHPAIRFNMVVCLLELGQPVEARGHLERSLAYGAAALGPDAYAQALGHRDRLDRQLVRLTLDCPEPDEDVLLDGQLIFKGPGQVTRFVLPGEHQVVASKQGYLPATKRIMLVAGKPETYQVRLDPRAAP